jgi:hypothetical protein
MKSIMIGSAGAVSAGVSLLLNFLNK